MPKSTSRPRTAVKPDRRTARQAYKAAVAGGDATAIASAKTALEASGGKVGGAHTERKTARQAYKADKNDTTAAALVKAGGVVGGRKARTSSDSVNPGGTNKPSSTVNPGGTIDTSVPNNTTVPDPKAHPGDLGPTWTSIPKTSLPKPPKSPGPGRKTGLGATPPY